MGKGKVGRTEWRTPRPVKMTGSRCPLPDCDWDWARRILRAFILCRRKSSVDGGEHILITPRHYLAWTSENEAGTGTYDARNEFA